MVSAKNTANPAVLTSYGPGGSRTVVEQLTLPAVTTHGNPGSATFVNGVQTSFVAPT
jgi:hypothetical protein